MSPSKVVAPSTSKLPLISTFPLVLIVPEIDPKISLAVRTPTANVAVLRAPTAFVSRGLVVPIPTSPSFVMRSFSSEVTEKDNAPPVLVASKSYADP